MRTLTRPARRCLLHFLLLLVFSASFAAAHELHLKNGAVIQTDSIVREGRRLSYEQYGGMITIDLSEVAEIRYDRHADAVDEIPQGGAREDDREPAAGTDMHALLTSKLAPSTPVEEANLAVVTIVTEAGSGSGFFISDDGLIVTNRHVIRGSEKTKSPVQHKLDRADDRLTRLKAGLDQEKERIEAARSQLIRYRKQYQQALAQSGGRIDPVEKKEYETALQERERYLQQWRADWQKREQQYRMARAEYRTEKKNYAQMNRRLAGQTRFEVILADGSRKSAVFYRTSDKLDLALLKLDGYRTPYLQPGSIDAVSLGQAVYAIGSPLRLLNSITSGVISNNRGDYIQTNAEIYPGNSGGPLITGDGRVVGVNTMKRITEKFEGIGFAIKISRVQSEFSDYLN